MTFFFSIQGVLLGLLLLPIFYKFACKIWFHFTTSKDPAARVVEGRAYREIVNSIVFYASLFVMLTLVVPAWMYFVQDFHVHPLLWYISSTFFCSLYFNHLPHFISSTFFLVASTFQVSLDNATFLNIAEIMHTWGLIALHTA